MDREDLDENPISTEVGCKKGFDGKPEGEKGEALKITNIVTRPNAHQLGVQGSHKKLSGWGS